MILNINFDSYIMSTYNLIIKKILKMDNSIFLCNYIDDGIDNIIKLVLDTFVKFKKYTIY